MKGFAKFAGFCFAGSLLGLITAQQAIGDRYGFVSQSKGAWTVWPTIAEPKIDPYTRAHHLSHGLLPSNRFETLEFEARVDDAGRALDGDCTYVVSGPMPRTRWWSLTAVQAEAGEAIISEPHHGLISQHLVYEPDGSFKIVVGPERAAGNWLHSAGGRSLILLLRLYTPESALRRNPLGADVPAIEREECR